MRQRIAYILFGLSSLFKGLGKSIIEKEPGFFIINDLVTQVIASPKGILKGGFEVRCWKMDEKERKMKGK